MDLSRCADFNPSSALSTKTINQNRNSSDRFTSCRKHFESKIRILTLPKVPELDSKKFLLDENFLPKLNFWLKTFFETRKGKGYWNRANMGFKTGMFKYFNELDEDCSGFLEPEEITSKLEIVCYKNLNT